MFPFNFLPIWCLSISIFLDSFYWFLCQLLNVFCFWETNMRDEILLATSLLLHNSRWGLIFTSLGKNLEIVQASTSRCRVRDTPWENPTEKPLNRPTTSPQSTCPFHCCNFLKKKVIKAASHTPWQNIIFFLPHISKSLKNIHWTPCSFWWIICFSFWNQHEPSHSASYILPPTLHQV